MSISRSANSSRCTGFCRRRDRTCLHSTAEILAEGELVTLGVSAKIIMVIEHQDFLVPSVPLLVEVGSGYPLIPPPTTIRSYVSPVSSGAGACGQNLPSRMLCPVP